MVPIELNIEIEDIKSLTQKVLDYLGEEKNCIKLASDYYWEIPMDERFLLDTPPKNSITLGSLSEDWNNIKEELRHEDESIVWWDCVLLSRLFMAIGYEILYSKKNEEG